MTFNYPTHINSNDSHRVGKRPNNYSVLAAFALIGVVTWLTGGNRESPCLGGACLVAALKQSSIPQVSGVGRTVAEGINQDIAGQTRETESLATWQELKTLGALRTSQDLKRSEGK